MQEPADSQPAVKTHRSNAELLLRDLRNGEKMKPKLLHIVTALLLTTLFAAAQSQSAALPQGHLRPLRHTL